MECLECWEKNKVKMNLMMACDLEAKFMDWVREHYQPHGEDEEPPCDRCEDDCTCVTDDDGNCFGPVPVADIPEHFRHLVEGRVEWIH